MRLNPQWICGFVDGEGCFTVSITACRSMKVGFQVLPEFVVVPHERDLQILEGFVDYFNCGKVAPNHGDRKCYRVRALAELRDIIIPFFKENPLQTKKEKIFVCFVK